MTLKSLWLKAVAGLLLMLLLAWGWYWLAHLVALWLFGLIYLGTTLAYALVVAFVKTVREYGPPPPRAGTR